MYFGHHSYLAIIIRYLALPWRRSCGKLLLFDLYWGLIKYQRMPLINFTSAGGCFQTPLWISLVVVVVFFLFLVGWCSCRCGASDCSLWLEFFTYIFNASHGAGGGASNHSILGLSPARDQGHMLPPLLLLLVYCTHSAKWKCVFKKILILFRMCSVTSQPFSFFLSNTALRCLLMQSVIRLLAALQSRPLSQPLRLWPTVLLPWPGLL